MCGKNTQHNLGRTNFSSFLLCLLYFGHTKLLLHLLNTLHSFFSVPLSCCSLLGMSLPFSPYQLLIVQVSCALYQAFPEFPSHSSRLVTPIFWAPTIL